MKPIALFLSLFCLNPLLWTSTSWADQADVVDVNASQEQDGSWRFDVTVRHADSSWEHYANEWLIVAPDDKILARRTLYHPHVNEQPFTRHLQGIKIPEDIQSVFVVAKDTVHHVSGQAIQLNLKTQEKTTIPARQIAKNTATDN